MVAFIGALTFEVILTFAVGLHEAFTVRQIPAHLAALLVGGLTGWLFELLRETTVNSAEILQASREMQTSFESLSARIKFQDKALVMLLKCPRHNFVISQLVNESISENFRNIPLIGTSSYLAFLKSAIVHSDGYEGIQRKPLSWFRDTDGDRYLSELRRRNMRYKTRLILIDKADMAQWNIDMRDEDLLSYYWERTGEVSTYWMTVEDFRANFPRWTYTPDDMALYDRQLFISYIAEEDLLKFDVVDPDSEYPRLFESINQLAIQGLPALHKLEQ